MKATVKWVDGAMFIGESGSGHSVVMDGPEDHGGRNMGVRPMEMLLLGLGGCTNFDVMSILRKQRLDVHDCIAEIQAERADAVPAVFTKIHVHFKVSGRALKPSAVEQVIKPVQSQLFVQNRSPDQRPTTALLNLNQLVAVCNFNAGLFQHNGC